MTKLPDAESTAWAQRGRSTCTMSTSTGRRAVTTRSRSVVWWRRITVRRSSLRSWLGALNVLTLRGEQIVEMTGFLDSGIHVRLGLPEELAD